MRRSGVRIPLGPLRRPASTTGAGRSSSARPPFATAPGRRVDGMSQPTPTQSIPLTDAKRWRAYWVCVAVAGLTILDLTKVNVALPSIESAFGASSTELQLIVSGYVLAFGLTLVPAGRIGDQRSRRALF